MIAAILKKPEETANQYLQSASFISSQAEVVQIVEELIGSKLTIDRQNSADLQKAGEEKLAKGDFSAFRDLVQAWNYADGGGHTLRAEDNADRLLGVPGDDLTATIKAWLVKAGVL